MEARSLLLGVSGKTMIGPRERLARLHLVWLWLLICVGLVTLSEITGAGMLDGGAGSMLFGLLFLLAAPFLIIGRLVVAVTAWAPVWLQTVLTIVVVLTVTTFADRRLTRWLLRSESTRVAS